MDDEKREKTDKIKVFSSDDEKLKTLGELLSNKSSRDIIKLLMSTEMYTNEIANKLNLRVNLVIYHLKKLEGLGLLQIQNKTIIKKGIDHKHYRINPYFFLAPSGTHKEIEHKVTLKKIFKDGIKFVSIAISGILSFFIYSSLQPDNRWSNAYNQQPDNFLIWVGIGLIIIISGLIISIKLKK